MVVVVSTRFMNETITLASQINYISNGIFYHDQVEKKSSAVAAADLQI